MARLISLIRLIRNLAALLFCSVTGSMLRWLRRRRGLPPRIWHGMFSSILTPPHVAADRAGGFPSRSIVLRLVGTFELNRVEDYTRVLEAEGVKNHDLLWIGLFDLLLHGDIWVAFFDGLFYPVERKRENQFILGLLRRVGIRIVMVNYGGDVVSWHRNRGRYDWIERLQRDYPYWDIKGESARVVASIRLFCEYADFVCNADSSTDRMVPRRDLLFKYFPVDCEAIEPHYTTGNAVPAIIHAPQHRWVKGTDYVVAAAERLKSKGFELELRLIERVSHSQALTLYAEADVIADQFCIGAWGAFAQEGLALGKPVLTYLDQEHLRDPAFNLPLINTTPENIELVLAVLVSSRELRERLGRAGRSSVERYHSVEAIAAVWKVIYAHVWWRRPLALEQTDFFSTTRQARAVAEDPADPDFWPVPVDDLMPVIRSAIAKASRS
jgi:glycosyltransferase involved in cell wall biosynthesis